MEAKNNKKFVGKVLKAPETRISIVEKNHLIFFSTYFNNYMEYPMAPMHYEMFRLSEDTKTPLVVLSAFRESSKSTIMNQSYALWSVFGIQKKKFIVIVSQTEALARTHFQNIKRALENNVLLRQDLGPFEEDQWNAGSLIIKRYNARIVAMSVGQSIRGLRHDEHRPDLIICDDVEDINSTRYTESREETYKWFNREIVTLGSRRTKVVVLGNPLCEDSLIRRLQEQITSGDRTGVSREYPVIDDDDNIYWPGKFPDLEAIKSEEHRIGDKFAWANEYLLKPVGDKEPIIEEEWIHRYIETPPELRNQSIAYASGVDLAVSEKRTADYTAIVGAKIVGTGDDMKIYLMPNPLNAKTRLPVTIDNICTIAKSHGNQKHTFYVEEVGTQLGVVQVLQDKDIRAIGVTVGRNDKWTRLALISDWIRSGKIQFPHKGTEDLERQMLNFGLERHDDLVDALTTLIIGIMEKPPVSPVTYEQVQAFGKALRRSMYGERSSSSRGGMGPGVSISFEQDQDGQFHRRY